MHADPNYGPSMAPPYWMADDRPQTDLEKPIFRSYTVAELREPDPVDARDVELMENLARLHGQTEGFIVGFGLALFLGLCCWLSA